MAVAPAGHTPVPVHLNVPKGGQPAPAPIAPNSEEASESAAERAAEQGGQNGGRGLSVDDLA